MSDKRNSMESSDASLAVLNVVEPASMERESALFLLRAIDELSLT